MKLLKHFKIIILAIFFLLAQKNFAFDIEVKVNLIKPNRVKIQGSFVNRTNSFKNWLFLQNYADVTNLGERIENVRFFSEDYFIESKKIRPGEFQTSEIPIGWEYEVNLSPPTKLTDATHASWLTENQGILMLADLLPNFDKRLSARLKFELPSDWKISRNELILSGKDIETAVFFVGKNWREKTIQIDKITLHLGITGEWKFSDDEAVTMASEILAEYGKLFKNLPNQKSQVILSPFPQENSNPNRWRAETRGETVTIISGNLPFKTQAVQRLNEQLRHELFHLWIPNGLALSGNYDWFYEGFAIYHALRTGVELGQIRFDDFLNTLSQSYRSSQMMLDTGQNFSLLELSDKRWMGYSNYLYAKGLAVAFLCDVAFLRESKGKRNLKDVFRKIYENHRFPNKIQDGNSAILSILNTFPELRPIVQNFIVGNSKIDWITELNTVGIKLEQSEFKVIEKPSGRQKDFLDKLGYNQWRKIAEKKR